MTKATHLIYRDLADGETGTGQEVHGVWVWWDADGELLSIEAPGEPKVQSVTHG